MKLINYKYGYLFDCSISGKIVCSANEWRDIQLHLMKTATIRRLHPYTQSLPPLQAAQMLREDMERKIPTRNGFLVNIRVTCTDEVVRHFKPLNACRHKRQNYMFEVITKKR